MRITVALASLAYAANVITSPVALELDERATPSRSPAFTPTALKEGCLCNQQATAIVDAFNYLLAYPKAENFNATAKALFSVDFTDTSDSINQLAGAPEGSVTFSSRSAFITGSGSQPPLILRTLDIFHSCDAISWRWISTNGTGDDSEPVKGIDNFYINEHGRIQRTYVEFNSGAWLKDLGNPQCSS